MNHISHWDTAIFPEDNLTEAAGRISQVVSLKGTEIGADASYQLAGSPSRPITGGG